MTPSNPDNNQPLIYRICDAAGVFHLVAPVNHTHSHVEIVGLAAALASKMDAKTIDSVPAGNADHLVSSKGVYDAIDGLRQYTDHYLEGKMDKMTIDSTPTENSDNLVTSGGVKAALDGKAPSGDTEVVFVEGENILLYLPNYFANGERQRSFLLDYQGDVAELISLFIGDTSDNIHILSHDSSTIMVGGCYIAVRVIKKPGGATQGDTYYIIFDGKADY